MKLKDLYAKTDEHIKKLDVVYDDLHNKYYGFKPTPAQKQNPHYEDYLKVVDIRENMTRLRMAVARLISATSEDLDINDVIAKDVVEENIEPPGSLDKKNEAEGTRLIDLCDELKVEFDVVYDFMKAHGIPAASSKTEFITLTPEVEARLRKKFGTEAL